jgi:hypothetical protein
MLSRGESSVETRVGCGSVRVDMFFWGGVAVGSSVNKSGTVKQKGWTSRWGGLIRRDWGPIFKRAIDRVRLWGRMLQRFAALCSSHACFVFLCFQPSCSCVTEALSSAQPHWSTSTWQRDCGSRSWGSRSTAMKTGPRLGGIWRFFTLLYFAYLARV